MVLVREYISEGNDLLGGKQIFLDIPAGSGIETLSSE